MQVDSADAEAGLSGSDHFSNFHNGEIPFYP
jgi:hypothetical protein